MGKWTRRAFITTGLVAGGGVIVGAALRPGNQIKDLAGKVGEEGGQLVHSYIKIDTDLAPLHSLPAFREFIQAFGQYRRQMRRATRPAGEPSA